MAGAFSNVIFERSSCWLRNIYAGDAIDCMFELRLARVNSNSPPSASASHGVCALRGSSYIRRTFDGQSATFSVAGR